MREIIRNINNTSLIYRDYSDIKELKDCKKTYFGRNERLLAVYGDHQVILFNMLSESKDFFKLYHIDQEMYEEILDLQLTSYDS